jgi:hypothetical protein
MKRTPLLFAAALMGVAAAPEPSRANLPSVGPDYRRPNVPAPAAYRDANPAAPWKAATPADALARGT